MKIEEYIQETPEKMKTIMEKSPELFKEISKEDFEKIIFTGSGTSYNGALQVKSYIQKLLKIDVEVLYPFMVNDELLMNNKKNVLLVGISQGGSSYSTYNAMKLGIRNGVKVASMAGVDNALIDEMADFVLTVHCGAEEAGPKTKGFNTTKLNIMLFGLHVALERNQITDKDFENKTKMLYDSIEKFQSNYDKSLEWVSMYQDELSNAKDIRIIGTGDLYGDVLEAALKLLETFRIPVTGYEFEEFIHGIYNAINEESTLIIFDSGVEPKLKKLIEVLSNWTEKIYTITNQDLSLKEQVLKLEVNKNNEFDLLQFITPVQLMCAKVPRLKGVNPNIPKDPEFHQKLESKRI